MKLKKYNNYEIELPKGNEKDISFLYKCFGIATVIYAASDGISKIIEACKQK